MVSNMLYFPNHKNYNKMGILLIGDITVLISMVLNWLYLLYSTVYYCTCLCDVKCRLPKEVHLGYPSLLKFWDISSS